MERFFTSCLLIGAALLPHGAQATDTQTTLLQFHGSDAWTMEGHIAPWQGGILGASGVGTALLMQPPAVKPSPWTDTVIYRFTGLNGEGEYPNAGLIVSGTAAYGTTTGGGTTACANGCGTIFKLSPPATGTNWVETQLYVGGNDANGYEFAGTPLMHAGKLYATAVHAANDTIHPGNTAPSGGTVLQLTPPKSGIGPWATTVIHHFDAASKDGDTPFGALIAGPGGTIIGTSFTGGACNSGTVWQLTPPATKGAPWGETLLHQFGLTTPTGCDYNDGDLPVAGVTLVKGVLYGTTRGGGPHDCGTAFSITLGATPSYQRIYAFGQTSADACSPQASLGVTAAGVVFGTTLQGGGAPASTECPFGCGTVFTLTPQVDGSYTETTLYAFTGGLDGSEPRSNLLGSPTGALTGAASHGGFVSDTAEPDYASYGTLFRLKP